MSYRSKDQAAQGMSGPSDYPDSGSRLQPVGGAWDGGRGKVKGPKVSMARRVGTEFFVCYAVYVVSAVVAETSSILLGTALIQGMVLAYAVSIWYHGGPHISPIVTIMALIIGKPFGPRTRLNQAIAYWIAQFAAAILAGLTAWAMLPGSTNLGVPTLASGTTPVMGWFIETLATTVVLIAILVVNVNYNMEGRTSLRFNNPAQAVGYALTASVMLAGPFTGGSINPMRHFGGAFFVGGFSNNFWWIYYVSPLTALLITWILYILLLKEMTPDEIACAEEAQSKRDAKRRESQRCR